MVIPTTLPECLLRPFAQGDQQALVRHGNDRAVWLNLADVFPHPYTREAADQWIALVTQPGGPLRFAIQYHGELVGGVGVHPGNDISRLTAQLGYWVGRQHWGKGIGTAAVQAIAEHAMQTTDLVRLEAVVFDWNPASMRVLEKAGFHLESKRPKSAIKDGRITGTHLFVQLRPDTEPAGHP